METHSEKHQGSHNHGPGAVAIAQNAQVERQLEKGLQKPNRSSHNRHAAHRGKVAPTDRKGPILLPDDRRKKRKKHKK